MTKNEYVIGLFKNINFLIECLMKTGTDQVRSTIVQMYDFNYNLLLAVVGAIDHEEISNDEFVILLLKNANYIFDLMNATESVEIQNMLSQVYNFNYNLLSKVNGDL